MTHSHSNHTQEEHGCCHGSSGAKKNESHDGCHANGGHGHHGSHAHEGHMGGPGCHTGMVDEFKRRFWASLALTAPILALSPLIRSWLGLEAEAFTGAGYASFVLATAIFFVGGWPFLTGLYNELKAKQPGMMTLIAVAITVAYAYSVAVVFGVAGKVFFWELATLIDVMLLGHWIEMRATAGASRALEELAKLVPSQAHKVDKTGTVTDVATSELQHNDRVIVKPGERVPADGRIVEGATSMNESMITGESKPVEKKVGDEAIGGAINQDGSVTVEVTRVGSESYLQQVMKIVSDAQASKSRAQDLANRAAFWLTIIALAAGGITMFGWLWFSTQDFTFALERTVTVMVITCPHALGLAVPLVVAVTTGLSARHGLLIKNRTAFEDLYKINAVVFDKTGTLTTGELTVSETIALDANYDAKELLRLAAAVEQRSEHSIARGIAAEVKHPADVKEFKAIPGKGARGTVEGKKVMVVSPGYLKEHELNYDKTKVSEANKRGETVVFIVIDGTVAGAVALADTPRPESKRALEALKETGIRSIMITGDSEAVAKTIAGKLGIDEYFAHVLPEQKAEKIKAVQQRKERIAMVGDGVNDAPALAQADVGIAIGAGTDVAAETADVVLVNSNPLDVITAISLSRAVRRKMIQNLFWATGYNAFMIPLAAGAFYSFGWVVSPAVGAALMSASTIVVAINAKLLRIPSA